MKTLRDVFVFGVLSFSMLPAAWAQQSLGDKYFIVGAYSYVPDEDRGTDREGAGADFGFGFQLSGPLYLELRAFAAAYEQGILGSDAYNGGVGADLSLLLGQRGDFSAFGLVGLGFAYNDAAIPDFDEGVAQASAGLGLLSRGLTSAGIRIRLDGRAIYEDYLDGVTDYRFGVGIEIPVDAAEVVVREVPVAAPAAAAPPVSGAYPPRPLDSDNDQVLDNFDACPGTMRGATVDRSGCVVVAQNLILRGVNFDFNSDRLTPESLGILDQAVRSLKGQRDMKVRIAGHTDAISSAEVNEQLSMRRASAVKNYLVSQGIAPQRLSVIGYGESQPIASNDTEAGRARNRRVEFEIQGQRENPR